MQVKDSPVLDGTTTTQNTPKVHVPDCGSSLIHARMLMFPGSGNAQGAGATDARCKRASFFVLLLST